MPKTISQLPAAASAAAGASVAADNAAGTLTEKVTLGQIATLAAASAPVVSVAGKTGSVLLVIADVSGLQTALDGKQASGSYAAATHTHSAADITSGTLGIARIPTGTTSATVCIGNDSRLSNARTPTAHSHAIADVTGLQTALDGKQASGSYAAAVHAHVIGDVTGLQTALDGKQAAGSYAAATHTHTIANVTGLQAALDAKATPADISAAVAAVVDAAPASLDTLNELAQALNDDANFASTVTSALAGKASVTHSHSASDVTAGTFDIARIPTGTTATTVCIGNDSRLTDSRTPSGAAGGDLSGTYPNPSLANSGVTAGTYTSVTVDAKGRVTAGSNPAGYSLPVATASVLGGVKIGSGISIDANGVISASGGGYTLPNATTSTLGGVIVGTGLGVSSGTVSVTYGTSAGTACQGNDSRLSDSRAPSGAAGGDLTGTYPNPTLAASGVSAGTYTSVTVDTKGRVTAGSSPAVAYSSLTGIPSTFTPAAHNHTGEEITSGTVAYARLPVGVTASTICAGNDPRLSDSRTPTSHTHAISDTTGLQASLDAKVASGRVSQSVSSATQTLTLTDRYQGVLVCSLTGNITLTMPTVSNGASFVLILRQDATGGRVATLSGVTWPTGAAPTLSTAASSFVVLQFFCDASAWYGVLLTPATVSSSSAPLSSIWSIT